MEYKRKILITGASGFIGQHLLEDLSSQDYFIRIITRDLHKSMRVNLGGIDIKQADLTDLESLKKTFQGIDCIINIAAEVRNKDLQYDTNIVGTKNMIQAIIACHVKQVIHISSVGVVGMQYSNSTINIDELSNCDPKNGYEQTKKVSEDLFLEAAKQHDFKLVILRPTNVFGEFHPFNALLNLLKKTEKSSVFFMTKGAMVNYLYVKDLTHVIIFLIKNSSYSGIINVGESIPLKTFMSYIFELTNQKIRTIYLPIFLVNLAELIGIKKLRALSNKVSYSDEKLKHFFDYPYTTKVGLERTIANYYHSKQL